MNNILSMGTNIDIVDPTSLTSKEYIICLKEFYMVMVIFVFTAGPAHHENMPI